MRTFTRTFSLKLLLAMAAAVVMAFSGCEAESGVADGSNNGSNNTNNTNNVNSGNNSANNTNNTTPTCTDGIDEDGDGYGEGCPAGPDCNDSNRYIHPGADEICNEVDDNCDGSVDEGVINACGNCSPLCDGIDIGGGGDPLPLGTDDATGNGVELDPNGDITLPKEGGSQFHYMWIANTQDLGSGTVSKIDTDGVREVARYYTVTCFANPDAYYNNGQCLDVYGNAVQLQDNAPSRTAVDYNFDVWVANRAFGGQASVTKIANSVYDCVDRNGDGTIQTSSDVNGDGAIETDCDGDGQPDNASTVCNNGLPHPEFYGLDDECVLFTTNYAVTNQLGRSVCLDKGSDDIGPANVWVGTFNADANNPVSPNRNVFYQIKGGTGEIMGTVVLPDGIPTYGCAVDGDGMLWTSAWGHTTFIDTENYTVGTNITESTNSGQFYGIAIDDQQNVWFGGWQSNAIYRYKPHRLQKSDPNYYTELANGTWTKIQYTAATAGIAADTRGFVWVADNTNGLILRINQNLSDGIYDDSVITVMNPGNGFGGNMRGIGIDMNGHVWGVSYNDSMATRLDLDANGDALGNIHSTPVGANPYTYSDFTGYGLRNFTRPRGVYTVTVTACPDSSEPPIWHRVEWDSDEPFGTSIRVYVSTGNSEQELHSNLKFGPWEASPAELSEVPGPVEPNPAWYMRIEFLLTTEKKDFAPVLKGFHVYWECPDNGPG